MKTWLIALLTLTLLTPIAANAKWYEATGRATKDGNIKSAKNRAIQDAIKQALLFSGAKVANIQKLSQGVLVEDQTLINAHGSVNQLHIVEEVHKGNFIYITVRADIFTDHEQCYAADFSKKIAITQFPIAHWQEAKIGEIYPLEREIPSKLFTMLQTGGNTVYPVAWLDKKLNVNPDFEEQGRIRHELIDAVAENANSQFVMFGRITDLSFGDETNSLAFWQDDYFQRFFSLEVLIANALTHEVLYQNRFHTSGEWAYSSKDKVNVNGRQFWQGEYGQAVESLLIDVRNDILAQLSCQKLQSKIMAVRNGDQIQLNIGRGQGVSVGQEYRVSYRADTIDAKGNLLSNFVISPYRVRVSQVFENSSIATSLDADFMNNVQVNDIIELQDWGGDW